MSSAAVVIGIDGYAAQPLTSAVADATAFRDALVDLGLVAPGDVVLLTAPLSGDAPPAHLLPTKKNIKLALEPYYRDPGRCDRLFVYFAGHGLLAFDDPAHAVHTTAIVPLDVEDVTRDGDSLIDLDDLVTRLGASGPNEQFWFIDACRDLAYDQHPDVGSLGWTAAKPGPPRAQAVLHAVAPLGQALGRRDGNGVMTAHLVAALRGEGVAVDYSQEDGGWVVTARSVANHVRRRVEKVVASLPLARRRYMLPELNIPGVNVASTRAGATPGAPGADVGSAPGAVTVTVAEATSRRSTCCRVGTASPGRSVFAVSR